MFLFCAFFFLVCLMANDVAVSRQRWPFQAASKSPIGHQRVNPMAIAGHGQKKKRGWFISIPIVPQNRCAATDWLL